MRFRLWVVLGVLLLGLQAGVFAETVYFEEDFSQPFEDADGNWVTSNWYDAYNYQISGGRLGLAEYSYAESNSIFFDETPSELIFSGKWGSQEREIGMSLLDNDYGEGVYIGYMYDYWYGEDGEDGEGPEEYLPIFGIYDDSTDLMEQIELPGEMTDFFMRFYQGGWEFTSGERTWSFDEGNPLEDASGVYVTLGAGWAPSDENMFEVYSEEQSPELSQAYFSDLKLYSPNVVPEPISSGLFLLGGGVLVMLRRKNRK